MSKLIIVGAGLAGGLAALGLARRRPDVEVTLFDQSEEVGGNHVWSFFDGDVAEADRWVLDNIEVTRWKDHDVRFPRRHRTIQLGYNSIQSEDFARSVRDVLGAERLKLGAKIQSIGPNSVVSDGGEQFQADAVIDARGQAPFSGLELGWQKFLGQRLLFSKPHQVPRPVIMDATVAQLDGYRFIYKLPFSERELLIEDTYYSSSPVLDGTSIRSRLAEQSGPLGAAELVGEESGVLPVVLGGDVDCLWRGEPIPRIGVRGGFFHPTTSYSLPDAVANAALLAAQPDLTSEALHDLFRNRARRIWDERSFFRLLNRMLLGAAQPGQSYRVLEHFYRLPPPLIARFYAGKLGALDKIRILSGRPPVPLGPALKSLRARTA